MFRLNLLPTLAVVTVLGAALAPAAFSQVTTTLRDPLIPGGQSSLPFVPPPNQPPPAFGDGPTPLPVNPGMGGPPTLLPWVPNVPSYNIDRSNSGIGLPFSPSIATPPGVLGPLLTPFVPNAPSTPGPDPGSLTSPQGFINPAQELGVNPGGGLAGTGGYNTTINKIRRGGQQTHQFEERGFNSVLGGGGNSQDEVTQFGPLAGFGVPYGVPTGNAYNNGVAGSNNDNRNSALDMGGGQRFEVGGIVIPMGQTLQDSGISATRGNGIGALAAQQSTEFGQGFRRNGVFSNVSTDYGFPYQQFAPGNVGYQKTGQLINPNAVETNF
jgi:hypothetical protein